MLQATLPCAPVLQVLDAHTWPANRNVDHLEHIASISRPLLHMRALVRLWISAISLEAMEHLAFLPSLENLSCCVRMLGREQTSTKLQYPSLKHATLGVHWDELSEFTRMLDRMVAPRLNILTIEYFVPRALSRAERRALPSTSHLDALCAALATFTALVSLDVDLGDDGEFPHMWRHDACLNGTALSRLFVLRNLRSLVMMPIPFDLRPHDIEAIAAAWPEMQSLRVGDMAPGLEQRTESLLRVDDLLPIALHCTQLTMLGLPLRIPAQYDDDPIPGPVDSVCPLRSLHAGEQGVTFSVRDAAVLTTFFPGVIMEDYSEIDSRDIEALRMTVLIETMTLLVRRERERRA
ncbi:hypothetical protein PsYK624_011490 [Phanerochaete sordida]|uniref:F-box domain-containing protein n=1 Tax=Phanerochaete sordida TaxID=48140 RepID=A0A9P3FXP1_9APHY|nr:hypothetical protein PsYK624_011490 [Phanerochaete sordida]